MCHPFLILSLFLLLTPFILSSFFSSSHPQATILTGIVLSKGCGQARTPILLVLTHGVNLICIPPLYTSSLPWPWLCLCWFHMADSFGHSRSSILFHLAVFQAVETHFAIFPLGFCHIFPVILDFYPAEEFEFLSVPLRVWCSDTRRWLAMHIGW